MTVATLNTYGEALAWGLRRLAEADADTPALDAEVLLAHVVGRDRAYLIAHPEATLSSIESGRFRAMIERRATGEPVQYLTGVCHFFGREFRVSPFALIPRPETEHLVEAALKWAIARRGQLTVVDVGTGCGAIAISLALSLPEARVLATDISPDALFKVALPNVVAHGLADRVLLLEGHLLEPITERVDLLVANLPYIPTARLGELQVARFEPRVALDGGPDGLSVIRELLAQATEYMAPGGALMLEIGADQGVAARGLAERAFPGAVVEVLQDYSGNDRVVKVELP